MWKLDDVWVIICLSSACLSVNCKAGVLLKYVTGSIRDERETEVSAGDLLHILMLPMLCDTKRCPECSPCWFYYDETQVSIFLKFSANVPSFRSLEVSELYAPRKVGFCKTEIKFYTFCVCSGVRAQIWSCSVYIICFMPHLVYDMTTTWGQNWKQHNYLLLQYTRASWKSESVKFNCKCKVLSSQERLLSSSSTWRASWLSVHWSCVVSGQLHEIQPNGE